MKKIGGYLLLNLEFSSKKDRDKFEKQFFLFKTKFKRMFQYIDDTYDCFYYPVWMGYAEPSDIIQVCKKKNIKIVKFLTIDLSTNGCWYDQLKEKEYNE